MKKYFNRQLKDHKKDIRSGYCFFTNGSISDIWRSFVISFKWNRILPRMVLQFQRSTTNDLYHLRFHSCFLNKINVIGTEWIIFNGDNRKDVLQRIGTYRFTDVEKHSKGLHEYSLEAKLLKAQNKCISNNATLKYLDIFVILVNKENE